MHKYFKSQADWHIGQTACEMITRSGVVTPPYAIRTLGVSSEMFRVNETQDYDNLKGFIMLSYSMHYKSLDSEAVSMLSIVR